MAINASSVAFGPSLREPGKRIYLILLHPFLSSKTTMNRERVRYLTPFLNRTERILSRSINAELELFERYFSRH